MHFLLLTLNMTDYPLFPNWRKERKIFPIHGTPTILGDRSFSFWLRMRIRVEHFFEVSPDPLFLIGPKTHQKTSTQVTSEIFFTSKSAIKINSIEISYPDPHHYNEGWPSMIFLSWKICRIFTLGSTLVLRARNLNVITPGRYFSRKTRIHV